MDWTQHRRPQLRPALEIYSAHGQSEFYAPEDPLSYEQVCHTRGRSGHGAHYARDAWAAGHALGVVAASDDHESHPGLSHNGLTAIRIPALTRENVFQAIASRQTYATTGERILLEFGIESVSMGGKLQAQGRLSGRLKVAAPSAIAVVEVLAFQHGRRKWNVVQRFEPRARMFESSFTVRAPGRGTTCYVRCELAEQTGGRVARAWSSPIWIR